MTKAKVLMHDDGYFIFRYNTEEDKDLVIHSGAYYFNNKPIILRPGELDFEFDKAMLSVISIWVKLRGLPIGYGQLKHSVRWLV